MACDTEKKVSDQLLVLKTRLREQQQEDEEAEIGAFRAKKDRRKSAYPGSDMGALGEEEEGSYDKSEMIGIPSKSPRKLKSFSLSGFYSDYGPRESWDAPMEKYAKQAFKSRRHLGRRDGGSGGGNNKIESVTSTRPCLAHNPSDALPAHSHLTASHSSHLIGHMQKKVQETITPTNDARSSYNASAKRFGGVSAGNTPMGESRSFVDHLKSFEKTGGDGSDDEGHFDFRSILRKTNFAPTASFRRRKGMENKNEENASQFVLRSPKVAVLVKPPTVDCDADSGRGDVMLDEDTVVDL